MRAPCCEEMGLKKGPWTLEEDQILISYIEKHGHANWRALPKQAGLLRCGKSCRLRWINYLRPDIRRGKFSKEEENAIIELQRLLGNRWSAIAAKLPGRTDNEIKNFWNTNLKKRIKNDTTTSTSQLLQNISASSWPLRFPTNMKFQDQDQARFPNESPSLEEHSIAQQQHDTLLPEPDPVQQSSCLLQERNNFSDDRQEDVLVARPRIFDVGTRDSIEGNSNSNLHPDINFWYNLFVNTENVNDFQVNIAQIQER